MSAMNNSTSPLAVLNTYHCICTTLILATIFDLNTLPRRNSPGRDEAIILPLQIQKKLTSEDTTICSVLHNFNADRNPVIVRREDGFEKRSLLRCQRCNLCVGYEVLDMEGDQHVAENSLVYLLPGGLVSTVEMKEGKQPKEPPWAKEST